MDKGDISTHLQQLSTEEREKRGNRKEMEMMSKEGKVTYFIYLVISLFSCSY